MRITYRDQVTEKLKLSDWAAWW